MTEQEKLERRIVLAEAMGWTGFVREYNVWYGIPAQGEYPYPYKAVLPDFDHDVEAREKLLEWFTMDTDWRVSGIHWHIEWEVALTNPQGKRLFYYGDTYADALLNAIYDAVQVRQEAEDD